MDEDPKTEGPAPAEEATEARPKPKGGSKSKPKAAAPKPRAKVDPGKAARAFKPEKWDDLPPDPEVRAVYLNEVAPLVKAMMGR